MENTGFLKTRILENTEFLKTRVFFKNMGFEAIKEKVGKTLMSEEDEYYNSLQYGRLRGKL